jgi:nicotinamide riboside transporter PnuC
VASLDRCMPCAAALLDRLRIEARTELIRMSAKSKPRLPLWIALVAAGCAIGIVSLINAFVEYWLGWVATAAVFVAMLIVLRRICVPRSRSWACRET